MTRPARRLLLVLLALAGVAGLGWALSPAGRLALAAGGAALWAAAVGLGRAFFRGRAAQRAGLPVEAQAHFERFLADLARPPRAWLRLLWVGLYTSDPAALAENNVGACLLARHLPAEAQPWLERALARDPGYAVPHLNLGLAAALRGDAEAAARHLAEARRLGYRARGLDALVRRALAAHNTAVGRY